MKLQTFTIYDSVHQQYFQPHHFENEGLSLRQFADLANEETTIAKNPEDYSLWHIGSFVRNNNWGVNPHRTCLPCQSTRARVTIQT